SALVDGGPARADWDSGRRVVLPALRALGVRRLRLAAASHSDLDHAGGLVAVARADRAEAWLIPPRAAGGDWRALDAELARSGRAAREVAAGWSWVAPGGRDTLRALYPDSAALAAGLSENDLCLVLEAAAPEGRVLLAGDLGFAGEARLVGAGALRPCAVLKVGHHGSPGSSSPAFLRALAGSRAPLAAISVARHSPFGHPSPAVEARLREAGFRLAETRQAGALLYELRPEGPVPVTSEAWTAPTPGGAGRAPRP
ncbi:MAG TPA: MBL fold metallo-hydrolase, partial [Candidatus Saccharimonadales bacterium]|nr:MBL fold metallo-hydrolase [Candidatus Saccharimonadales bacterium]